MSDSWAACLEKKKKAEDLIEWYRHYERIISERIGPIDPEKRPAVFYYSFIYSNLKKKIYNTKNHLSSGHAVIETAGGINIGRDLPREHLRVSGEWLADKNPDVIIGDVIGKDVCGYNADELQAALNFQSLARQLEADEALKNLNAGQTKAPAFNCPGPERRPCLRDRSSLHCQIFVS